MSHKTNDQYDSERSTLEKGTMIGTTQRIAPCDVCRILDFNVQQKNCTYCSLCDAWICDADLSRWDRRFRAAVKRKLEPGYKGLQEYEKVAKGQQQ
jgi:hypothetical protein